MSLQLPIKALREDREVLAIPIGLSRNEFVLTKIKGLRTSPGWLTGPQGVTEWRLEGFFKQEERLFLYGPYEPGEFLEEVLPRGAEASLACLIRMIQGLLAIRERGQVVESLQTDAVRFLASGEVLFLPPAIVKQVRSMLPEAHRLRVHEPLNHPDLADPADRLSFAIASLLWRLITGEYPFAAETGEEIRQRTRTLRLPPLTVMRPGIKEEVAAAVADGLGRGSGRAPSLERWLELLQGWQAEGLYRTLSEAEIQALSQQARQQSGQAARSYRRRLFVQRHWKVALIIAAAAAAVGIFSGTILKKMLEPRATRGYSPARVVETFYRSVNALDHETMQDCVAGKAGTDLIRAVINTFVISRVNLGYEGRSNLVAADEWERQGRPALEPPAMVFGITGLEVRQEQGEPQPVFRVAYELWMPASGGTEESPRFGSTKIEARVYLRRLREYWVIHRIEAVEPEGA